MSSEFNAKPVPGQRNCCPFYFSVPEWVESPFLWPLSQEACESLEEEMPQMTLLARSLYVILSFIAYLGSDLHEFQWLRVFKGQELVKVSEMTIFYLHCLRVVWNTVEDAVSAYIGNVDRPYIQCSETRTVKESSRKEGLAFSPVTYLSEKPRPCCFYWEPCREGQWRGGTAVNPQIAFLKPEALVGLRKE